MKGFEAVMGGMAAIMAAAFLALTPFINIFLGWWLAPLLLLGGFLAIFAGIFMEGWEILRFLLRYVVCLVFRDEAEGYPATHHHRIINVRIWRLVGGGHCHGHAVRF